MPRATSNFIPKFQLIADELIAEIKNGRYGEGELFPAEKQLVERFQVSRQTIRNALGVLSDRGLLLSPVERRRVLCSRKEPQGTGSGSRLKQIGFIYRPLRMENNIGFFRTTIGLKSIFSPLGYSLAMSVAERDQRNQLYPTYPEWLRENLMDGYLLHSAPAHVQEQFQALDIPVVNIGYRWTGIDLPSVEFDFQTVTYRAIQAAADHDLLPAGILVGGEDKIEERVFYAELLKGYSQGVLEKQGRRDETLVEVYPRPSAREVVRALARLMKRRPDLRSVIIEADTHLGPICEFLKERGSNLQIFVLIPTDTVQRLDRAAYFSYDPFVIAQQAGEMLIDLISSGTTAVRHVRFSEGEFLFPPTR